MLGAQGLRFVDSGVSGGVCVLRKDQPHGVTPGAGMLVEGVELSDPAVIIGPFVAISMCTGGGAWTHSLPSPDPHPPLRAPSPARREGVG